MEKQKASLRWRIFSILVALIIAASLGFSWGVHHQAMQDNQTAEYSPLYTSRIIVKCGNIHAVAFTAADCDSIRAKDDGWWFNKLLQDTSSFTVTELMEWPYLDQCD